MNVTLKYVYAPTKAVPCYFIAANRYDMQRIEYEFNTGDILQSKIRKGRTLKRLGEYWLIMTGLAFQFGANKEHWHIEFKKEILGTENITNFLTGKKQTVIPSISFDSGMGEERFEDYVKDVKKILLQKGIDYKELINNLPRKKERI